MPFDPGSAKPGKFDPSSIQGASGFTPVSGEEPEEWESALHGAGQGATFGFSDELYGGARSFWESGDLDKYEQYRDEYRQELESQRKANPKSYLGGEIAGGVAAGAATGGITGAASTIPKMIGVGAATGGLYGAGASEGDSALEVAADAGTSAAMGGAFGGVIGGAAKGVSKLWSTIKPSRAVEVIYNDIIERTGMDHASINKIMAEQPEFFLADMHPRMRSLLHEVGGPKALKFLEERTRGTADRVMKQIARRTGIPEIAQLSDDVSNAYRNAHSTKLPLTAVNRLRKIINPDNKFSKKAEQKAMDLWRAEPDNAFRSPPEHWTVEWMDYLQRGYRQVGVKKGQPKEALNLYSKQIRDVLSESVPDYAAARDLSHKQAVLKELWESFEGKSKLSDITKALREKPKEVKGLQRIMDDKFDDFVDDLEREADRFATFKAVGKDGAESIAVEDAKKNLLDLGLVYAAGIGLGAQKGLAVQAAYMRLLRGIVFRNGGKTDSLQAQLAQRLLSNAPVKPLSPLAGTTLRIAGGAGVVPGVVDSNLQGQ